LSDPTQSPITPSVGQPVAYFIYLLNNESIKQILIWKACEANHSLPWKINISISGPFAPKTAAHYFGRECLCSGSWEVLLQLEIEFGQMLIIHVSLQARFNTHQRRPISPEVWTSDIQPSQAFSKACWNQQM